VPYQVLPDRAADSECGAVRNLEGATPRRGAVGDLGLLGASESNTDASCPRAHPPPSLDGSCNKSDEPPFVASRHSRWNAAGLQGCTALLVVGLPLVRQLLLLLLLLLVLLQVMLLLSAVLLLMLLAAMLVATKLVMFARDAAARDAAAGNAAGVCGTGIAGRTAARGGAARSLTFRFRWMPCRCLRTTVAAALHDVSLPAFTAISPEGDTVVHAQDRVG
jgi:hypothetical protein